MDYPSKLSVSGTIGMQDLLDKTREIMEPMLAADDHEVEVITVYHSSTTTVTYPTSTLLSTPIPIKTYSGTGTALTIDEAKKVVKVNKSGTYMLSFSAMVDPTKATTGSQRIGISTTSGYRTQTTQDAVFAIIDNGETFKQLSGSTIMALTAGTEVKLTYAENISNAGNLQIWGGRYCTMVIQLVADTLHAYQDEEVKISLR